MNDDESRGSIISSSFGAVTLFVLLGFFAGLFVGKQQPWKKAEPKEPDHYSIIFGPDGDMYKLNTSTGESWKAWKGDRTTWNGMFHPVGDLDSKPR